jgi:hypothetical protein
MRTRPTSQRTSRASNRECLEPDNSVAITPAAPARRHRQTGVDVSVTDDYSFNGYMLPRPIAFFLDQEAGCKVDAHKK